MSNTQENSARVPQPEKQRPRRLRWWLRRLLWTAVAVAILIVAAVVLLPSLLPDETVRREVEAMLAARMGRAVTVRSARFRWNEGLEATGIQIAQAGGESDSPLARIERLTVRMRPTEVGRAAAGADAPIESIRVEGLELWLVLGRDGVWNFADMKPTHAHAIQVAGGTIHVENQRLGRSLTFTNVHSSLGELASTGQGYLNLTAELAAGGRFLMTATLDSLNFTVAPSEASVNAEWQGVSWHDVAAVLTAEPRLLGAASATSGRAALDLRRGTWSADGAVQAAGLSIPESAGSPAVAVPEVVIGFNKITWPAAGTGTLTLTDVTFTAPGVILSASGTLRLPESSAPAADASAPPVGPAPARTAGAAPAPAPPAEAQPGVKLQVHGNVLWGPLCRNILPLKNYAERFEQLGGGATFSARLISTPSGMQADGRADLDRTVAVWTGILKKQAGQMLRLEGKVRYRADLGCLDIASLEMTTDAGRAAMRGRLPITGTAKKLGDRLAGAYLELLAEVKEAEVLLAMVPAVAAALGPADAHGPLLASIRCEQNEPDEAAKSPAAAAAPPSGTWTTILRADLTGTLLGLPNGTRKRSGTRAMFEATAVVAPDDRRANLTSLRAALAGGTLEWAGSAQMDWGGESPVGRFEGTLTATGVESAGAVLLPGRFAADAPAAAGDATLNILADLAGGRIRGKVQANLDALAVRILDYFVKPAGEKSRVSLTGFWQPPTSWMNLPRPALGPGGPDPDHHILAEAEIEVPGVRARALARGILEVRRIEAPAAEERPVAPADQAAEAPAAARLDFSIAAESTLELHTSLADIAKALELSPALKRGMEGYKAEGKAESVLVLARRPRAATISGNVDLAGAALDFGNTLRKPRDMPCRIDIAMTVMPPQGETYEAYLTKLDLRLAESSTGASGRVKLTRPTPAALANANRIIALLQEADLEVHADWVHSPEFRAALPWLQDRLYSRADLDGLTHVAATFSGTPLRGKVRLDVDATACGILHGPAMIIKPRGTPATARIDARYGEVPGELILDSLALVLADSTVQADGRMLFENPRMLPPAAPTSWTIHLEGRAPDAAALASLFPARLGDLKPTGGVQFKVRASGDPMGAELQTCDLAFGHAAIVWLDKPLGINGAISYDGNRLATDGLNLAAGGSDITLVAYIQQPDRAPTGSMTLRGSRLDLNELQDLIQRTSAQVSKWAAEVAQVAPAVVPRELPVRDRKVPGPKESKTTHDGSTRALAPAARARPPQPLSEQLALYGQGLLARAQLSCELDLKQVSLTVPEQNVTYELAGLAGEGRLAGLRFVVPRFQCALNQGTIRGEFSLDFHEEEPLLELFYDARDLKMADNLRPFIDTTFPGMKVFGTVNTTARVTQRLAEGAFQVGRGETILTDGLLEGPSAPSYITSVLPGLKLTQYRFSRMSNVFENKADGSVENRMLFDGTSYDIFMFGSTLADGRFKYTLGVDLSVGLGSKVISRALDQGKLPLLHYTGRIAGAKYAEREIEYVLPHEFAYDVFVRRSLLIQVIRSLGEKPPDIPRPVAPPPEKSPGGPEASAAAPQPRSNP